MKTRRVTRYIADCGRGFWTKDSCKTHDENCTCWTNPKHRTCKTCKRGSKIAIDGEDGSGGYWECDDPKFIEHDGAPKEIDYISVNCRKHVGR